MNGKFIDRISLKKRKINNSIWESNISLIDTDFGKLRVLDTKGDKPIIINAPDGPNIIEHQEILIHALSKKFRVICFEFPGLGFSYPSSNFDYSVNNGANTIINLMDILNIEKAILSMSCSNGFYGIKAAEIAPEKFTHLFLSQTPSNHTMKKWTADSIPNPLRFPIIGELLNSISEKKLTEKWYKIAYPKNADTSKVTNIAFNSFDRGSCFCLSGLVQGIKKDIEDDLIVVGVPSTLVWGNKDYSHRNSDFNSIVKHLPDCNIVEFNDCGHFPELESTKKYIELINEELK